MKTGAEIINYFSLITIMLIMASIISCSKQQKEKTDDSKNKDSTASEITAHNNDASKTEIKVTFIELGSVNCIPCRQMQPVMKSIEEKYKGKVNVVFHDVWKDKSQAQKYGIQLIPTQVFLDENGKEFYRHEGFLAESEIIKLLESRNVKP